MSLKRKIAYRLTIQVPEFNRLTGKYSSGDPLIIENNAASISVIKNIFSVGGASTINVINLDSTIVDYITYDRYTEFVRQVGSEINAQNIEQVKSVLNGGNIYPRIKIELIEDDTYITVLDGVIEEVLPPVRITPSTMSTQISVSDVGYYLIVGKMSSESIVLKKNATTLVSALNQLESMTDDFAINYNLDYDKMGIKSADLISIYNGLPEKSIPVSGRTFQEVMLNILEEFNITDFNASNSSLIAVDDAVALIQNTKRNEYLQQLNNQRSGKLHEIGDEQGLMAAPRRENEYIVIETVFNPHIKIGDRVKINSKIITKYNADGIWRALNNNKYNGELFVQAVMHSGDFNSPVSSRQVTTVQLYTGGINFENRLA